MKDHLKTLDKINDKFFYATLLFWAGETVYFLIAYGWHWTAINEAERECDRIVGILISTCCIMWGVHLIGCVVMIGKKIWEEARKGL